MKKKLFIALSLVVLLVAACVAATADCVHNNWTSWTITTNPTCQKEGVQTRYCRQCPHSETRPVAVVPHDFLPATCTKPATCKFGCGATRGTTAPHDYAPATCVQPKKCRDCGAETGSLGSHNFAPATCAMPQKCRVCGVTTGSALGHNWVNEGSYTVCTRCGSSRLNRAPALPE